MNREEIKRWQNFLLGFFLSTNNKQEIIVDGVWGPKTELVTKLFQNRCGISETGKLDAETISSASDYGYSTNFINLPLPKYLSRYSDAERELVFGKFKFNHTPTPDNPELITVADDWASKNLVKVVLPGMSSLVKKPVLFHKQGADKLFNFFVELGQKGLTNKIISWDGSYSPRFIRGSRTRLSNHSWGTAFDINAFWNPLGSKPAAHSSKGSVLELVEIANQHGFFWGGHFNRLDGMHFELAKSV
jgi:hypothetical protein